ncbi:hypothetical protein [Mycobacterium sp. C31M]
MRLKIYRAGSATRRAIQTAVVIVLAINVTIGVVLLNEQYSAHDLADQVHGPAVDPDPPWAAESGWGPARDMFTLENPAPYVTMNSLHRPTYGDERNYFRIKPADASASAYSDQILIKPMARYTGFLFVENAAAPRVGPSLNTRVRLEWGESTKGSGVLNAYITADNALPERVWDSAAVHLPSPDDIVWMRIVPDSAVWHTLGRADGSSLAVKDLFSPEGALVGCDAMDGVLSGESRCVGYLTFDFVTDKADFLVTGKLSVDRAEEFGTDQSIKADQSVTVTANYQNTGSVRQNDVKLVVTDIPECSHIDEASIQVSSRESGDVWRNLATGLEPGVPLALGSFMPGGGIFVRFDLKFCNYSQLSDEYSHDFDLGALWSFPDVAMRAETYDGTKSTGSLPIAILGPNQIR